MATKINPRVIKNNHHYKKSDNYNRRCHRCDEMYKTMYRNSKICPACNKRNIKMGFTQCQQSKEKQQNDN